MKPFHDLHNRIKSDVETVMTLRDYFAAKAMQSHIGLAGSPLAKELEKINPDSFMIDHIAMVAYKMADEMIKEREKTNG